MTLIIVEMTIILEDDEIDKYFNSEKADSKILLSLMHQLVQVIYIYEVLIQVVRL